MVVHQFKYFFRKLHQLGQKSLKCCSPPTYLHVCAVWEEGKQANQQPSHSYHKSLLIELEHSTVCYRRMNKLMIITGADYIVMGNSSKQALSCAAKQKLMAKQTSLDFQREHFQQSVGNDPQNCVFKKNNYFQKCSLGPQWS